MEKKTIKKEIDEKYLARKVGLALGERERVKKVREICDIETPKGRDIKLGQIEIQLRTK